MDNSLKLLTSNILDNEKAKHQLTGQQKSGQRPNVAVVEQQVPDKVQGGFEDIKERKGVEVCSLRGTGLYLVAWWRHGGRAGYG